MTPSLILAAHKEILELTRGRLPRNQSGSEVIIGPHEHRSFNYPTTSTWLKPSWEDMGNGERLRWVIYPMISALVFNAANGQPITDFELIEDDDKLPAEAEKCKHDNFLYHHGLRFWLGKMRAPLRVTREMGLHPRLRFDPVTGNVVDWHEVPVLRMDARFRVKDMDQLVIRPTGDAAP